MKTLLGCSIASIAMATGVAQGDLANGDFSDGGTGWNLYGGIQGPYDVGYFGGSDAVVAYGTFSGVPNYSGASQDITGYAEGDTIEFGGQMYIEAGKELYGANTAAIKITFWYGDGTAYGFDSVAGIVDANSASDTVFSYDGSLLLDASAASATRVSFDFSYIQSDIPPNKTIESGAAWGTNFYANVVPSPGALALLGLAGFSGRRRRQG